MAKKREKWLLNEEDWQKGGVDTSFCPDCESITKEQFAYVDYVMRFCIKEMGNHLYEEGKYRLAYNDADETERAVNNVLAGECFWNEENYERFYSPIFDEVRDAIYEEIEMLFPDGILEDDYPDALKEELQTITKKAKAIRKELKRLGE